MENRTIKMVKQVTTLIINDRTFYIQKDNEGYYWGIEDKDMGKESLNGLQGNRKKTLKECLEIINIKVKADELKAQGYSRLVAAAVATGAMSLEEALAREAEMNAAN